MSYELWLLFIALCIFVSVALLFVVSGLFESILVVVKTPPIINEKFRLAYKTNVGTFGGAGYLYTEAYAIKPGFKQCGIFYDDSTKVDSNNLRSAIGSILIGTEADEEYKKRDFKIAELPGIKNAVVSTFPNISFVSVYIASWRVYAAMRDFIEEKQLQVETFVEVYDAENIHFIGIFKEDAPAYMLPGVPTTSLPTVDAAAVANDNVIAVDVNVAKAPFVVNQQHGNGDVADDDFEDTFVKVTEDQLASATANQ